MSRRLWSHIRSNVVAYIALFFALSGGTAYALTGSNTVFSDDITNGEVKTGDVANDSGAGALKGADVAANSLTGSDVTGLTGDDIANVERAVDIPLPAFVGCNPSGAAQIPFQDTGDDANANPSYNSDGFRRLQLVWDDDGTQPDLVPVCTSVRVPDDYVSGGDVILTGVTAGGALDDDWQVELLQNRDGSGEDQFPTILTENDCDTGNVYACRVDLGTAFTPGDMLTVGIQRVNSSPDETRLLGVHFVYTASG